MMTRANLQVYYPGMQVLHFKLTIYLFLIFVKASRTDFFV